MLGARTPQPADRLGAARKLGLTHGERSDAESGAAELRAVSDWCERQGHPCSRLSATECCCGMVRYDD